MDEEREEGWMDGWRNGSDLQRNKWMMERKMGQRRDEEMDECTDGQLELMDG